MLCGFGRLMIALTRGPRSSLEIDRNRDFGEFQICWGMVLWLLVLCQWIMPYCQEVLAWHWILLQLWDMWLVLIYCVCGFWEAWPYVRMIRIWFEKKTLQSCTIWGYCWFSSTLYYSVLKTDWDIVTIWLVWQSYSHNTFELLWEVLRFAEHKFVGTWLTQNVNSTEDSPEAKDVATRCVKKMEHCVKFEVLCNFYSYVPKNMCSKLAGHLGPWKELLENGPTSFAFAKVMILHWDTMNRPMLKAF